MQLRETFIMQFSGGPYDTESHEAPAELDWPLPQEIKARDAKRKMITDGRYVKIFESQSSAQSGQEARGAIYEWKEE